jgi:hypothetical protein
MNYTDDQLSDMSDEELERVYRESLADTNSPDTDIEEEYQESNPVEDDSEEDYDNSDEELEDGSEQPEDADSDHDASDDAEEEVVTEEDTDVNPDEGTEETAKGTTDKEATSQPVHKFKANGKEYEFTEAEIKERFPQVFGQAMDYTRKMQQIKPWRKTIDAIEQAKLTHEDLNLAIDVLKGDKDAIAEIIKRTGVDALDLNVDESNYVAKDYGRDDTTLEIKDVLETISRDPEFEKTHSILEREWDEKSWQSISQDPEKIRLLHIDVKSGMYDKVQPMAEKLKVFDGGKKSDLDYYALAAQNYFANVNQQEQANKQRQLAEFRAKASEAQNNRVNEVKAQDTVRKSTKAASAKRKAAAPTKSGISKPDVVDYLDDSDEAFEEWYKKLDM